MMGPNKGQSKEVQHAHSDNTIPLVPFLSSCSLVEGIVAVGDQLQDLDPFGLYLPTNAQAILHLMTNSEARSEARHISHAANLDNHCSLDKEWRSHRWLAQRCDMTCMQHVSCCVPDEDSCCYQQASGHGSCTRMNNHQMM